MGKTRSLYRCSECRHTIGKWVGRCPECGGWGVIDEVATAPPGCGPWAVAPARAAVPITSITAGCARPRPTGVGELDRVFGGGVVPGSVTLLAGEPGVGKSTLLLAAAHRWAEAGGRVLYVAGEESGGQVRLRADRTGCGHDAIFLAVESDLQTVLGQIETVQPTLVVVDSVQTVTAAGTDGVTGGVSQVRAVTAALTAAARAGGVPLILVGHVTKDGAIAGPRSLEHLVDVVLHFDGDRTGALRTIRAVKNRFGSTDEVGCFLLQDGGIAEVPDPSGLFLQQRRQPAPGTAITVTLDGRRALAGEIQALLTAPSGGSPRRAVSGVDHARAAMITAVLAEHAMLPIGTRDVYLSTVGGMRLTDPSSDLAVAVALASAYAGLPLPPTTVVIGEVGLAGDLRPVSGMRPRLAEAARLGFTTALVPREYRDAPAGLRIAAATDIASACSHLVELAEPRAAREPALLELLPRHADPTDAMRPG